MSSVPSVRIDIGEDPKAHEEDHVHTIYNEIASHFSQTRYKPWPIVQKFLETREDYSIGIDVGCGNGKYLGVNKKLFMIGTDRSDGLITCAREVNKDYNVGVSDGLNLAHPNDRFDFAISIAVIHHFSTEGRRIEAISHILSKLKKGGEFLIYCWALEQEKSRRGYKEGDDQDILIPWVLQQKQEKKSKQPRNRRHKKDSNLADTSKSSEAINEEISEANCHSSEVSQEKSSEQDASPEQITRYRYYHLYKRGELVENALSTKMCTIVDEGYEKDNWWVIVRKI